MNPLVDARRLSLAARLKETSLTLAAGELTALVGPNGSGKTSLLHALAGIGAPGGEVLIGGRNPATLAPEQRQRLLSYLPASRDIIWPLTGRDLIGLGRPDGTYLARLVEALDLPALVDRRVDQMSTGERSRALIARALAPRPKLLLLDEPAANLDPLWQLRLMDLLRRDAHENGQAALIAVHDLDLAGGYADRLLVMNDGAVVADGGPAALLEGAVIADVFGIRRRNGRWAPV